MYKIVPNNIVPRSPNANFQMSYSRSYDPAKLYRHKCTESLPLPSTPKCYLRSNAMQDTPFNMSISYIASIKREITGRKQWRYKSIKAWERCR